MGTKQFNCTSTEYVIYMSHGDDTTCEGDVEQLRALGSTRVYVPHLLVGLSQALRISLSS